jgi:hypothetical protein
MVKLMWCFEEKSNNWIWCQMTNIGLELIIRVWLLISSRFMFVAPMISLLRSPTTASKRHICGYYTKKFLWTSLRQDGRYFQFSCVLWTGRCPAWVPTESLRNNFCLGLLSWFMMQGSGQCHLAVNLDSCEKTTCGVMHRLVDIYWWC